MGIAITVAIALVLAALTLRMSGHYLPLATIAWGLSLNYTMANVEGLGRYDGLLGIPAISVFGISLHDGRRMYVLIWLVALVAALATQRLLDSRTRPRHPRVEGRRRDGRGDGHLDLPLQGGDLRLRRGVGRRSRAGCSRTTSAR